MTSIFLSTYSCAAWSSGTSKICRKSPGVKVPTRSTCQSVTLAAVSPGGMLTRCATRPREVSIGESAATRNCTASW